MALSYCNKCKLKTEQRDSEVKTTKKGMNYSVGICVVCGKKTSVMLKKG